MEKRKRLQRMGRSLATFTTTNVAAVYRPGGTRHPVLRKPPWITATSIFASVAAESRKQKSVLGVVVSGALTL